MTEMKNLIIAIVLAMGVFFFLGVAVQLFIHRRKPATKYVCPYCGEHDCICEKE